MSKVRFPKTGTAYRAYPGTDIAVYETSGGSRDKTWKAIWRIFFPPGGAVFLVELGNYELASHKTRRGAQRALDKYAKLHGLEAIP